MTESRRRWTCEICKCHFSTVVELTVTRREPEGTLPVSEEHLMCIRCLSSTGGWYVSFAKSGAVNLRVRSSGADEQRLKDSIESLSSELEEYLR